VCVCVCVVVCVCVCVCVWCGLCVCGVVWLVCVCVSMRACACVRVRQERSVTTVEKNQEVRARNWVLYQEDFWIVVRDGRSEGARANGRRTAVGMVSGFHRICQHLLMAVFPSSV